MRRWLIRGGLLMLLAIAVGGCLTFMRGDREDRSITIPLDPENPSRTAFGALTYMGGIEWQMARPDFGGISGLHVTADGTLTAVTDKAHWIRATLAEDDAGRLKGIRFEAMGRMRDAYGHNLDRPFADSEALTPDPAGGWLVSFEGTPRVLRFAGLDRPGIPLPLDLSDETGGNSGLESMAHDPEGRLILIAEDSLDGRGGFPGWIIGRHGRIERFRIERQGGFNPTDLAIAPDGMAYLLERRFSFIGGVAVRLRRFPSDEIRAGARISGESLFEADQTLSIDNMEGLSLLPRGAEGTDIYMISDDNFNGYQRTLILKFRLPA